MGVGQPDPARAVPLQPGGRYGFRGRTGGLSGLKLPGNVTFVPG